VGRTGRRTTLIAAALLPVLAGLTAGAAFSPAVAAVSCPGRVASDLNGDLVADLLIGDPLAGPATGTPVGGVIAFYGSDVSQIPEGNHSLIGPDTPGMPAGLSGVGLGSAVTIGYFNDDCFADAAIGAPGANAVVVLYGTNSTLSGQGSALFNLATFGGSPAGARLGSSLASGDFDGDGWDDLAIGAPRGSAGGAIGVLYGSATGLSSTRTRWITQATSGVPGADESGDAFGTSLAAGDVTGDRRADLVVGIPGENIGSTVDAGAIVVLRGASGGLTTSGSQGWSQDSSGVPGTAERSDRFGASVAVGDITGDGRADVAVGAPGEAIGTKSGAGAVGVFRGVAAGLTATASQLWSQDSLAVPGGSEPGDGLGSAVVLADFTLDGRADLVAGVPGEDIGTTTDAGAANLLRGSANMLFTANAAIFDQSDLGQPVQAGSHLGAAAVAKNALFSTTASALILGAPGQLGPNPTDVTGAIVSVDPSADALNYETATYLHAYFFLTAGRSARAIGAILG
jgi:hypothetical protein